MSYAMSYLQKAIRLRKKAFFALRESVLNGETDTVATLAKRLCDLDRCVVKNRILKIKEIQNGVATDAIWPARI